MGRYDYGDYGGWPRYVPVAERRRQAAKHVEALRRKGQICDPVTLEGRAIARSFWGKAWCENLEAYSDYANRLPRGRTYVRNGSVVDLQIAEGRVRALVAGSEVYRVEIGVQPLEEALWKAILKDCAGGIGSLVELLQGRLSDAVMAVVTRPGTGLFPTPRQVNLRCSCPDGATMCKHVAAVLYGVGARLDRQPELLFRLRHVDPQELIQQGVDVSVVEEAMLAPQTRIERSDLGRLFGIELDEAPAAAPGTPPAAPLPSAPPAKAKAPSERPPHIGRLPKFERVDPTKPTPPVASGPHGQKNARRGRNRGKSMTARELTARGIPHSTLQNWLNTGVLVRTERRGVYRTTEQTEERIARYLERLGKPGEDR
jgi:uncharacterized Zn finger protein